MSRIAVASFGSEGDVRPFVALARGLRRAGHDAYLVASSIHARRAAEAEVPLRAVGPAMTPEAFNAFLHPLMQKVMREKNPLRAAGIASDQLIGQLLAALPDVIETTREADLIVHHQIDVAAYAAARIHDKPRVAGHVFQGALPAVRATPDGADHGPLINRALTEVFRFVIARVMNRSYNRVLAAAGLPPHRAVFLEVGASPLLNLLEVSPAFVPTDPLWRGQRVVQTGYWFLDAPRYEPPADLEAFFAAGAPPVVVTFGSMAGTDARQQTALLCEGIERAGVRAVLQAGWNQLGEGALPASVKRVDYVPHDWLFARAACVVHHGGAGTTASALRAGVPQIIIWHMGDQEAWGKLAWRRGVAPRKPVSCRALTAEWLAGALREATGEPQIRERAAAMGARVRAEDGVANAVAAINELFGRK